MKYNTRHSNFLALLLVVALTFAVFGCGEGSTPQGSKNPPPDNQGPDTSDEATPPPPPEKNVHEVIDEITKAANVTLPADEIARLKKAFKGKDINAPADVSVLTGYPLGTTLLHRLIEYPEACKVLSAHGADWSKQDGKKNTPLHLLAVQKIGYKQKDITELLNSIGTEKLKKLMQTPNADGNNPLFLAVGNGKEGFINAPLPKDIIKAVMNNCRDNNGKTLLQFAYTDTYYGVGVTLALLSKLELSDFDANAKVKLKDSFEAFEKMCKGIFNDPITYQATCIPDFKKCQELSEEFKSLGQQTDSLQTKIKAAKDQFTIPELKTKLENWADAL